MTRTLLMATCVLLVALALPRFINGRPAIDDTGSSMNTLDPHGSKLDGLSNYKGEAISSIVQGSTSSIPARSRQGRSSDQRLAELKTLISMSEIRSKLTTTLGNRPRYGNLNPALIGRRRRSASLIPYEKLAPIHRRTIESRHNGDPAYPLIS